MPVAEVVKERTLLVEAVNAHHAGDVPRAQILYDDILRRNPRKADAMHLLGVLAQQSGDLPRARKLIEESLSIQPNMPRAYYNLATVRALQDDVTGAIAAYEVAITLAPNFAEAHSNLGNLYKKTGKHESALRAYSAAIRAQPGFAAAYCNLATLLIGLKRYNIAIRALEQARQLAPDMPEVHANLAEAYRRSGRVQDALVAGQRALELRPDRVGYLNLAFAATKINALDVARDANRRAAELEAADADRQCNLGWDYLVTGRYSEAIVASETAIALKPDYAEAHVNLAVSLLVQGEFARGWDEFAWVWRLPAKRAVYWYLDHLPLWNGEDFKGRRLLITRDQGFGDTMQMVRYLPAVRARGGCVVLETPRALMSLFEDLPGVDELRPTDETANLQILT